MKKVCFVATLPAVVHAFLRGHIRASKEKWEVKIISHPQGAGLLKDIDAEFIPLPIERRARPWKDLQTISRLIMIFWRERFDLVYSVGPKTGLLAMTAGRIAGIKYRIHIFTGQGWVNKRGWARSILKIFDKLIALFATHILVDSPSQLDFLISEGVLSKKKGIVIAHGSICGVDQERFHPDSEVRAAIRTELNIPVEAKVILFVGRINHDKGVIELTRAFASIAALREDVFLLFVGSEEDISFAQIKQICGVYQNRLRKVDFTPTPEEYMSAADIFALPSHREGFGQVLIEAAASGLPAVATRIYGIIDAVEEGESGLLSPVGEVDPLTQNLLKLIADDELRHRMGCAALERALNKFSSRDITAGLMVIYTGLLGTQ